MSRRSRTMRSNPNIQARNWSFHRSCSVIEPAISALESIICAQTSKSMNRLGYLTSMQADPRSALCSGSGKNVPGNEICDSA